MIPVETEISVAIESSLRPAKAPRWRCRRPGLWFCYWLGKHYATARREQGRWTLTIFTRSFGASRHHGWATLRGVRFWMNLARGHWRFKEPFKMPLVTGHVTA